MTAHRIRRFERQLALVIGIDYAGTKIQLANAEADADAMSRVLREHHGYDVIDVRGANANRRQLLRLFAFCLKELVTEDTQLLVYFAGHGLARESAEYGLDGFLMPSDATHELRSWIPMRFIRRCLSRLPCHHLLVVLDCCFAGSFAPSGYRDLDPEPLPQPLFREEYEHYLRRRAAVLLASSAYDEKALDRLLTERAPFTSTLVGVLDGSLSPRLVAAGRDKVITANDLYGVLRERLGTTAGVEQTPNLWPLEKHDVGEYVFVRAEPDLPPAPKLDENSNPYRGLRYYGSKDASVFKGRARVVASLKKRAMTSPCVVLLGSSGSGKSSVLHAGLAPALDNARVLGPLRIGLEPLRQLAEAVAAAPPAKGRRTCLLVDQLDELVAVGDEERRVVQALLAMLVPGAHVEAARTILTNRSKQLSQALRDRMWDLAGEFDRLRGTASVVFGLRSDVEPHFLQPDTIGALLGETWKLARMPLPAMNREELRECIVGPAAEKVVFFSASPPLVPRHDGKHDLVDVILEEIEPVPDALPLLSVALERMFTSFYNRKSKDRTIDWVDYPEKGGIVGALQDKAERLHAHGGPEDEPALTGDALTRFRKTLKRLMLYLVSWRGTTPVRHVVSRNELVWDDDEETARASEVLDLLIRERLVVTIAAERSSDDSQRVQLVHDALLSGWPRLWRWLQRERARLLLHDDLREATRDWIALKRRRDRLWSDTRAWRFSDLPLRVPRSRRDRLRYWLWSRGWALYPLHLARPHQLTASQREFAAASLRARRKRNLIVLGVTVGVFVILTVAVIATYRQSVAAKRAEDQARSAEKAAVAEATRANDRIRLRAAKSILESDPTSAAAILREVEQPAASGWADYVREVLEAGTATATLPLPDATLLDTITAYGRTVFLRGETGTVVWHLDDNAHVTIPGTGAISADGSRVAAQQPNTPVELWDVAAGTPIALAVDPKHEVASFSSDGARLLTSVHPTFTAPPKLFDPRTGSLVATLEGCGEQTAFVGATRVLTWRSDGMCVWDAVSGKQLAKLPQRDAEVAISPRGDRFVTLVEGRSSAQLRDASDGHVIATLATAGALLWHHEPSWTSEVRSFSPDGARVLLVERERFSLWDAQTGRRLGVIPRTDETNVTWGPRGNHLIVRAMTSTGLAFTGGAIYSAASGARLHELPAGERILVSPTENQIAILGPGETRLVEMASGKLIDRDPRSAMLFSPDGRKLVVRDANLGFAIVDPRTGNHLARIDRASRKLMSDLQFSSDSRLLLTSDPTQIWSSETGDLLATLSMPMTVRQFALLADRDLSMIQIGYGTVYLWKTRELVRPVGDLAVSDDGRIAAMRARESVEVRRTNDWERVGTYAISDRSSLALPSPDGAWVAIVEPSRVQIVNASDGSSTSIAGCGGGSGMALGVRIEWTSTHVVVASRTSSGCVVKLADRTRTLVLPPVRWFLLAPSGRHLVIAPREGTTELRDVDGALIRPFAGTSDAAAFSSTHLVIDDGAGLVLCTASWACTPFDAARPDAVSFAPDGEHVFTRSRDGTFRRHSLDGQAPRVLGRGPDCADDCSTRPMFEMRPADAFAFSEVPPRVAISELERMWDLTTGLEVHVDECENSSRRPMTFARGLLLTGGCILDGSTGTLLATHSLPMMLAPDGALLTSLTEGGFRIYDVTKRIELLKVNEQVNAFSRDHTMYASYTNGLSVFRIGEYTPVARVSARGFVGDTVAFSEHDKRVIYSDSFGVHAPLLRNDDLRESLARTSTYCLTIAQRRDLLEESEADARSRSTACLAEKPGIR